MANAAAMVSLQTLRDLLIEEVRFLWGVSDKVEVVQRQLNTIHSFLLDADKWSNRNDSATLRDWMANLEDLASKARTVLDKYEVEVASGKDGRNLKQKLTRFACILCECVSVHQVGRDTDDITSRLADLTARVRSLPGGEGSSNPPGEDERHLLRLRYEHEDEVEQYFVGMEKDIECLVSLVTKNDVQGCGHRPVISICGMGGLGKTTLARKIYNNKDVVGCFEARRAWVCVTQQFHAKAVVSEILRRLLPDNMREQIRNMGKPELVAQLHNVMKKEKCMIVIDDIWEKDHWDILKTALPIANCKVVLTTRYENIVSQECVYKLDFLTEDQGWELIHKIAILPRNDAPALPTGLRSLEAIGRQIVQKCGCLPLAISIIGGIFREKRTLAEWEEVNSNMDSYLEHGGGVQRNKGVQQVLDLSYNMLPYYLKPCFLYLGCFPEDEEIRTEKVYLLWIAEGVISAQDKKSNETLRNVAERYLTELAFRCMVQVVKEEFYTPRNKFKSCRLHDLVLDLCLSKAEEDNFFKRVSVSSY